MLKTFCDYCGRPMEAEVKRRALCVDSGNGYDTLRISFGPEGEPLDVCASCLIMRLEWLIEERKGPYCTGCRVKQTGNGVELHRDYCAAKRENGIRDEVAYAKALEESAAQQTRYEQLKRAGGRTE